MNDANDTTVRSWQTSTPEEESILATLRVQDWEQFIGQANVKQALQIALAAAKQRQEPLDHALFYGPPGLGKTTLSHLIAREMGVNIKITSGTALNKAGDVAAILSNLQPGDVLFIDEIHRLPKAVEETLYPAMEDFVLDIMIGKGPTARTVRLELPHFTLVGATTRYGLLAAPFRDRFGMIHRLEHYGADDLQHIITQAAEKLSVLIDQEAAHTLARRSRGTPRIALKLLKRVRDFTQVQNIEVATSEHVERALQLHQVDDFGLDDADRRLLSTLIKHHGGGPVGIGTIAASLQEDQGTIEEVLEPYLLQIGFLQRTPKGRVVTKAGYTHLGESYQD